MFRLRHGLMVALALVFLMFLPPPAAAVSLNMQGYTSGGSFTFADSSWTIPVGATLEMRIWVDLMSCDPVTVDWGDGSPIEQRNYGSAFSGDWTHEYAAAGSYVITATENLCPGTNVDTLTVTVGSSILDPAGPLFMPALVGVVLGIVGVGLANGKTPPAGGPRGRARGPGAGGPPVPPPRPRLRLLEGIPASMVAHLVSLRDIPTRARLQHPTMQPPRIGIVPLEPTNLWEDVPCQHGCGKLGYTVAGWFCTSPACPGRGR
jgi:hypothetical protein